MKIIGVIGGGVCSRETGAIAEEVGLLLAEHNVHLICGGLGGVMEAACRGAKRGGATTIGILPRRDSKEANPWVDLPIVTGLGEARNLIIVQSSQAIIAIGGEYGTLSEIAVAMKFKIPVITIGGWRLQWEGQWDENLLRAADPAEAVEMAVMLVAENKEL